MYYNDEIKQKYLSEVSNYQVSKSLFSKLADYEAEIGCDIGQMTKAELLRGLITNFMFLQVQSTKGVLIRANNYRKWYADLFRLNDPEMLSVDDIDFSEVYRQHLFGSWDEILKELPDYDFSQGDETGAAIALCWLGFKLSDSVELLESQVDWKNGLVFDKNGSLIIRDIDPKILHVLSEYKSCETGYRVRNHHEKVSKIQTGYFLHRMDVANTVRENDGKMIDSVNITKKLAKLKAHYESKTGLPSRIAALNIWYSGNFLRLYRYMSNHDVDNDKVARFKIKEISQSLAISVPEAKLIFESYKKAFNLD